MSTSYLLLYSHIHSLAFCLALPIAIPSAELLTVPAQMPLHLLQPQMVPAELLSSPVQLPIIYNVDVTATYTCSPIGMSD